MLAMKYILRMLAWIPLLPWLYYQGQGIRRTVPRLPVANDPAGTTGNGPTKLCLITLGESTMAGVGVETHRDGFSGTLAEGMASQYDASIRWKVFARSGLTASGLADMEILQPGNQAPDLIVIGTGANDAFRLNAPWHFRKCILRLINKLRNQYGSIPIVFLNMPPVREFPAFTPLIRRVVGSHVELLGKVLEKTVSSIPDVYYVADVIKLEKWKYQLNFRGKEPEFFSDGVHPSPLTYQVWARETVKFIRHHQIL